MARDKRNGERIFPYLGGEEVNDSPTHAHHRFIIAFESFPLRRTNLNCSWHTADVTLRAQWLQSGVVPEDYPYPVAADWPDLLAIVKDRVSQKRLEGNRSKSWWQFERPRPELSAALLQSQEVLLHCQTGQAFGFAFSEPRKVFSHKLIVFPKASFGELSLLQSRVHEVWARLMGSSQEDRPVYTPTDCFQTFPFPSDLSSLQDIGRAYYDFRARLMVQNNEGLTKTYNRFHDPEEQSEDFKKLRSLHHAMDRAVLDAYGWTDIQPVAQHEAEFEEEAIDEDDFSGAKKPKQKYRLRWPEEVRDDVLARLLILNEQCAAAEALEPKAKKKGKRAATPLFDSRDLE